MALDKPERSRRASRPRWTPAPKELRPRFALTEDDLDILETVGRHKVLDSEQLERVFTHRSPQNLRRRLDYLFQWLYLGRPKSQKQIPAHMEAGDGRPYMYVLRPKGAKLLAERRGLSLRGYASYAGLSSLDHERLVSEFMLRQAASCTGRRRLAWLDELLLYAPEHKDRDGDRWRVKPVWKGNTQELWLRPDRTFGLVDLDQPPAKAGRFYFLEIDRGTMPLKRRYLSQSSIFRKFLSYSETYKTRKHTECFGFPNMRVLFVARSKQRSEGMRLLFQKHKFDLCSQKLFLFTDWAAIRAACNLFEAPWYLADGSEVRLSD